MLHSARADVAGCAPQGVGAAFGAAGVGIGTGCRKALGKLALAVTELAQQACVKRLVVQRGRQTGPGVDAGQIPALGWADGRLQAGWGGRGRVWGRVGCAGWPDPLGHGGKHGRHVERFGDVVAHAGCYHFFAVAGHGVGRHGDDGHLRQGQILSDFAGGGVAVHDRHLAVHQHPVKSTVPRQDVQRLLAMVGHHHRDAGLLQQLQRELLVHVVVFHQQHACTRQLGHRFTLVFRLWIRLGFFQMTLVQSCPDTFQQGRRCRRLGQSVLQGNALLAGRAQGFFAAVGCDHDHGRNLRCVRFLHQPHGFDAVHAGHVPVHQ